MNKRSLYHFAVDTFLRLFAKSIGYKINYRCNNNDVNSFYNFLEEYRDVSIGENFVREYIEYGFQYYTNDGEVSTNMRMSWIFSKNAIKRFKNGGNLKKYRIRKYKVKNKIKTISSKPNSSIVNEVRLYEEKCKKRFFNGKRGLAWCIAMTSLYFHKSSFCVNCVYKDECKEIEKINFPNVYKSRGYK